MNGVEDSDAAVLERVAILGLAGYLFSRAGRSSHLPTWTRMVSAFAATAIIGLVGVLRIDNIAHIGGAITGMGVGLLFSTGGLKAAPASPAGDLEAASTSPSPIRTLMR